MMQVSGLNRRSAGGFGFLVLLLAFAFLAASALAEPYRLVPGDRLLLNSPIHDGALSLSVNIDGEIRLPEFGAIGVADLDLEGAESRIAQALQQVGQFVDPKVDLAISDYAPVVVAGEVAQPGRFEFVAGLTVAAALALAGGADNELHPNRDRKFILADLAGRQRGHGLNILALSAKIARLEALLKETGRAPKMVQPEPVSIFWEIEQRALLADQNRHERLIEQWSKEIAALQKHQKVVQSRFKVQQTIVTEAEKSASTARALKQRGLQTAGQLAASELLLANARKDTLELQSLQVSNEAALARAELARESYLAQRGDRLFTELQSAQLDLAEAQENQLRVDDQMNVLQSRGMEGQMRFRILSLRPGRQALTPVSLATRLLPGDTLVVSSVIEPNAVDG